MPEHKLSLRAMLPSDSAAVADLIADFDGDITTRFLIDAYTAITAGSEYRTLGVVAEGAGVDGLVGMGTVRFSTVQFNDRVLPLAFLDGLKVRREFRGKGLGHELASWRVQQAREAYGEDCVIATGMLQENLASRGVARKWSREFVEPIQVLILPTRSRPPASLRGITVREIQASEYAEFAAKQNSFFKDYNLYAQGDPESLAKLLGISLGGIKPYRIYVAADASGNLLAGAQVWLRGALKVDTINQLPAPLLLLNSILHILPPDRTIRDLSMSGLWHAPGRLDIAQTLWETMRWQLGASGTILAITCDPRDPILDMIRLKPWHQPRPKIAMAIHGPFDIDRAKLIFGIGRV